MWTFENRIGEAGAKVLFDGVTTQLLKHGYIARGGQIIDATLVPPKHGDTVHLQVEPHHLHWYDPATGQRV